MGNVNTNIGDVWVIGAYGTKRGPPADASRSFGSRSQVGVDLSNQEIHLTLSIFVDDETISQIFLLIQPVTPPV